MSSASCRSSMFRILQSIMLIGFSFCVSRTIRMLGSIDDQRQFLEKRLASSFLNPTFPNRKVENGDSSRAPEPIRNRPSASRNVTHVILTRFMQRQPKLKHLGKARLDQFKAICLPSIRQQTNQNFLWIIRTDPELELSLKVDLIDSVGGMSNVILVGSNHHQEGGLRNATGNSDIQQSNIWHGTYNQFRTHASSSSHVTLETNLDADDGLSFDFVEVLQSSAVRDFAKSRRIRNSRIYCVRRHLEWHSHEPPKGLLVPVNTYRSCITAGLTFAYRQRGRRKFRVMQSHQKIKLSMPECGDKKPFRCWTYLSSSEFMAIRSRSPTSAGMNGVVVGDSMVNRGHRHILTNWKAVMESNPERAQRPWNNLHRFGVTGEILSQVRTELMGNLQNVVQDSMSGACTEGHSCHEFAISARKTILDNIGRNMARISVDQ